MIDDDLILSAALPLCCCSPTLPVPSMRSSYRSARLRAFQTIPPSQHALLSSSLKPITCVNSLSTRTPPRYVRWPWPGCWWSCPPSTSWLHRPSSPWASREAWCMTFSSNAATTTSFCYLMPFTCNSECSTPAVSTFSSTSWGRQGFARNLQNLCVLGFWRTGRQDWRKTVGMWTQWQQERRLYRA